MYCFIFNIFAFYIHRIILNVFCNILLFSVKLVALICVAVCSCNILLFTAIC